MEISDYDLKYDVNKVTGCLGLSSNNIALRLRNLMQLRKILRQRYIIFTYDLIIITMVEI